MLSSVLDMNEEKITGIVIDVEFTLNTIYRI
jgi:hypothetical protein